jgi:hypothetical protein
LEKGVFQSKIDRQGNDGGVFRLQKQGFSRIAPPHAPYPAERLAGFIFLRTQLQIVWMKLETVETKLETVKTKLCIAENEA